MRNHRTRWAAVLLVSSFIAPCSFAQTDQPRDGGPRFTAASLKPFSPEPPPAAIAPPGEEIISERVVQTTAGGSKVLNIMSPGRIHSVATVRQYLAEGHGVKEFQIEGPGWMDTQKLVLDATMPPDTDSTQRVAMLKNLLTDRFRLATHRATKELPVYSLVVAKNGLKMKQLPDVDDAGGTPVTTMRTSMSGGRVRIRAQAATMRRLADELSLQLNRPVKDETGSSRKYDFLLTYSADQVSGTSSLPDAPDLFHALPSQLGVGLRPGRSALDLIVIDHIERTPSEN